VSLIICLDKSIENQLNGLFSKNKVMSNSDLESDIKVPAPLNLPFGKLFFGFKVAAYTPPAPTSPGSPGAAPPVSQEKL
jgi:ubiquitin fusion degradation protein 1